MVCFILQSFCARNGPAAAAQQEIGAHCTDYLSFGAADESLGSSFHSHLSVPERSCLECRFGLVLR